MRVWIGLLLLLSLAAPARAQTADGALPAALRGDYFQVQSAQIGRAFHIHVRYPEGYDPSAARLYPTIYLTAATACSRSWRPITCS